MAKWNLFHLHVVIFSVTTEISFSIDDINLMAIMNHNSSEPIKIQVFHCSLYKAKSLALEN